MNPDLILPTHYGVAGGGPPASKRPAGGSRRGEVPWNPRPTFPMAPRTPALGPRAQGHAGSCCSRQQRGAVAACRRPCSSHGVLVPTLFSGPAQPRAFRRPGHGLHFPEQLSLGGWVGAELDPGPSPCAGTAGKDAGSRMALTEQVPPRHCPPHSPLPKPREEKPRLVLTLGLAEARALGPESPLQTHRGLAPPRALLREWPDVPAALT